MGAIDEIWRGLRVTGRLFSRGIRGKDIVTTEYPKEMRAKPQRFHGRHVLNRYPDGMEKCIGCELCAGACPARCIYVRGADNPSGEPVSPGERYGFVYEINMLRCIFCGLCVEACPTEAITMTHLFEMSTTNRDDSVYTKTELLMDRSGAVPHMFPDDPLADQAATQRAGRGDLYPQRVGDITRPMRPWSKLRHRPQVVLLAWSQAIQAHPEETRSRAFRARSVAASTSATVMGDPAATFHACEPHSWRK